MSAIDELSAGIDAALAADARSLPASTQVVELESLLEAGHRLQALLAERVKAAYDSDATVLEVGRSVKSTLIEEFRLDGAVASRTLRLAHGLPAAARVQAALRAGDISADHAVLVLKALRQVTDPALRETIEIELVTLAMEHPVEVVRRAVTEVLDKYVDDTAAGAAHDRRYGQRGFRTRETFGGAGSVEATLTPETAEKQRLYFAGTAGRAGAEDARTLAQRQHDAYDELLDFGLAHMGTLSPVDGQRPRVVVHIDHRALLGLVADHEAVATLGSGVAISPATARRLACDAQLLPAVLGTDSEVLDIGGASRHPTAAITRATYLRDGGRCTFPRCRRRNLRQHHMKYWAQWHQTSYDVMAWVCSFHHWLVHEGGWTMRREHGRSYVWTGPTGREVRTPPEPGPPPDTGPPDTGPPDTGRPPDPRAA